MAVLTVEREFYETKDKRRYYDYFVRGVMRGKDVRAYLMPKNKDFSGYEVLDMIFDIAPTAQLIIKDEKTETASGAISTYKTYTVQNTDEDGTLWEYKLKPRAESDKSILNILLQKAEQLEKAAETAEESKA